MKFASSVFLGALLAASQPALANIDIQFDYRYDSSGFFTGANSSRQDLLNAAASVFESRFQDNLTAISSPNTFSASFYEPDNGKITSIPNFGVAADQIVIFVGAYNLGGTLAVGGPGGSPLNDATSRGSLERLLLLQPILRLGAAQFLLIVPPTGIWIQIPTQTSLFLVLIFIRSLCMNWLMYSALALPVPLTT